MLSDSEVKNALTNPRYSKVNTKQSAFEVVISELKRSEDCEYYGDFDNNTLLEGLYDLQDDNLPTQKNYPIYKKNQNINRK